LVSPSSRAAVFVVSPIAVYSMRRAEPTLPAITGPVCSPMPTRNRSPDSRSPSHALNAAIAGPAISCAVATARSAWSGWSSGAPKRAMIPSPM
jgi:hypothetical protein